MAPGNALHRITTLRPTLSERFPNSRAPTIGVSAHTPITKPVSPRLSSLAVLKTVGVHEAELHNTEPPKNSARASTRMLRLSALRNESPTYALYFLATVRIRTISRPVIAMPKPPTVRKAARQPARAMMKLEMTEPREPPIA